ncbi:MAG: hypothetical protein ABL908_08600 [Hyphomicrobium sp.]
MLGGAGALAQSVDDAQWSDPNSAIFSQLRTIAGSDGVASAQDLNSWALPVGVPQSELNGAIVEWTNAGFGNPTDGFTVQDVIAWIVARSSEGGSGGANKYDNLRSVAGADGVITEQEFLSAYFSPESQGGPSPENLATFMTQLQQSGAGDAASGYSIDKLVLFLLGSDASSKLPQGVNSYTIDQVLAALPAGVRQDIVQLFIDGLMRTADGAIAAGGLHQAITAFVMSGQTGNGFNGDFGGYQQIADNWTPGNTGGTGGTNPVPDTVCTEGANGQTCRTASNGRLIWRPSNGSTLTNSQEIKSDTVGGAGIVVFADQNATLVNTAKIETSGEYSSGISASGVIASLAIENRGAIKTTGEGSAGISVQSGRIDWVWNAQTGSQIGNIEKIWPGTNITVRNYADISTTGLNSSAIFMMSGMNSMLPDGSMALVPGGSVAVHNEGRLSTAADQAMAIFARSEGNHVNVTNSGAISTLGIEADGIHASATGTGSVAIDNSGGITVRGSGSAAIRTYTEGSGGVTVRNSGAIDLLAQQQRGIEVFAEGTGEANITNSGTIVAKSAGSEGISVWANNGKANVTHSGSIRVEGGHSYGIVAHSENSGVNVITAGDVIATGADSYAIFAGAFGGGAVSIDVQGRTVQGGSGITPYQYLTQTGGIIDMFGGSAGVLAVGGDIAIKNAGQISALNGLAIAVLEGEITVKESVDDSDVKIDHKVQFPISKTSLTNTGEIVGAVKLGSGGNVVANAGSITGDVDLGAGKNEVKNSGSITGKVSGGDSGNSLVNSIGGLLKGLVSFGSGADSVDNAGRIESEIALGDGANKIDNRAGGTIAGALKTGAGDDLLSNAGTISGNIDLGGGANTLDNLAGGLLTGSNMTVGSAGTLTNAGDLSAGGQGIIGKTLVVGNFVQAASGRMIVDINEAAAIKSDTIEVTGRATLAGLMVPHVIDLNQIVKGEYRVLTAAGGAVNNGLAAGSNLSAVSTVGYDFGIEFRNTNDVFLIAARSLWRDNLGENGATIWMRRSGRAG